MKLQNERIPFKSVLTIGILPGPIKVLLYKLKGYKIGKKVKIGFASVIQGKNVSIGGNVHIGAFSIIKAKTIKVDRFTLVGSFCFLKAEKIIVGEDSRIRENVLVGGIHNPDSDLIIGKRCLIMQGVFLNPTKPITIGDDTAIGGFSKLFTHSSWLSVLNGYPAIFGPIEIGKNVWIPFNTFINPNVKIGNDVVIMPNSMINKNIPDNSFAGRFPLKIVKNAYLHKLEDKEKNLLFNDIEIDFIEYMKHFGYAITKRNEKDNVYYSFAKGRKKHNMIVLESDYDSTIKNNFEDSVIILKWAFNGDLNFTNKKEILILSLLAMERKGSSEIGEFFIQYLSRYGIRFSRRD